MIISDRTVLTK